MKKFRHFPLLALLLLFSCATKKTIRTTPEVEKTYNRKKVESIDLLLEASIFKNRDIVASSIYYLGQVLGDLEHKPKKWKLKSNEIIQQTRNDIVGQLLKVHAINDDFNLKLLILESLSQGSSGPVYAFYLERLQDKDPAIVKMALIKLRPYAQNARESTNTYDLKKGFERILPLVTDDRDLVSLVAIDTLFYFPPQDLALEKLAAAKAKQEEANKDKAFMKKMLEEKMASYQEYLKGGRS